MACWVVVIEHAKAMHNEMCGRRTRRPLFRIVASGAVFALVLVVHVLVGAVICSHFLLSDPLCAVVIVMEMIPSLLLLIWIWTRMDTQSAMDEFDRAVITQPDV